VGLIGQHQALDGFAVHEVLLDELRHVGDRDVAVPDLFGIHDNSDAFLTLIEATSVVRADEFPEAARIQLLLQLVADFAATAGLARAFRMTFGTFVDADKDVTLKTRHLAEA